MIHSFDLHGTIGAETSGNGNAAGASGIWKKIRFCGICGNPYSLNGTC